MNKPPVFTSDRDADLYLAGMRVGSLGGQEAALNSVLEIIDRYKTYDRAGSDETLANLYRDIVAELQRLQIRANE